MVTSGQQPLGQLLLEMGFIDGEQLRTALEEQTRSGKRLGRVLIDSGVISEDRLVHALSKQLGIEACDPIMTPVHDRVLHLIPADIAFKHKVLPVARQREDSGECLYVATSDPLDKRALQAIRTVIAPTTRVRWMLAGETEMELALQRHYRPGVSDNDRAPPPRETVRGSPVPSGIQVLQGKPLNAPPRAVDGTEPRARAKQGSPGAYSGPGSNTPVPVPTAPQSSGSIGLHAHSSTNDIFNALEQAVLQSGDLAQKSTPPPPPAAILRGTGDLAIADPSRWTGGDLAPPEAEVPILNLGTNDLLTGGTPMPSLDLVPLADYDAPPPPMSSGPAALEDTVNGALGGYEELGAVDEIIDGEPLSGEHPVIQEPEDLPIEMASEAPAMAAPPLPVAAPIATPAPPSSRSAPATTAGPRSSPSSPAMPRSSSWGDLLDDPNPHSVTASLRPSSTLDPISEPTHEPLAVEAAQTSAEPSTDLVIEELERGFEPIDLAAEPISLFESPSQETPALAAGRAEDDSQRTNALDVPESSPLLDTGEATAELPFEMADEGDTSDRLEVEPIANFLEMADIAGVSSVPTTIPSSADEEASIELLSDHRPAPTSTPPEDLPEASADAVFELEPKPITADIVPLGRAAEVRDQMLRFVSGEDQTPETQRYVLRVITALLLYEGMLDDDRLLHALEKLREK